MNLTIIGTPSELSANEQKALYAAGADLVCAYYIVADAELFTLNGRDVVPNAPALRHLSSAALITWVLTEFRGKRVAFGTAAP